MAKREPRPDWLACRRNFPEISHEERVRRGRINGKKGVEARRKKKMMKDAMQLLLDLPANDSRAKLELIKRGVPKEEITNLDILVNSLWKKAAEGDVAALREVRNLIGQDDGSRMLDIKEREFALKEKMFGLDDDEDASSLKIEIVRASKK